MSREKLPLNRLAIGLYIQVPLAWMKHPFAFGNFKIKDQSQINILHKLGLKFVFYYPDKSDTPAPKAKLDATHNKSACSVEDEHMEALWLEKQEQIAKNKTYLRKLKKCQKEFNTSLVAVRSINLKLNNQSAEALEEANQLMGDISSKLMAGNNSVLHLMENGKRAERGGKYHSHVYHVAILSMILGNALKLSKAELTCLGLGALFHDIGKSKVPDSILNNKPDVTKAEENFYKMHVKYGIDNASRIKDLPDTAHKIIHQHHEYLDGSGYPNQLTGKNICLLSQIVAVANEFDNLCNPTDKHKALSPHHALSYLYKKKGTQLNKDILGVLIKKLGVYPPGCIVQLTDSRIALVISVSENEILHPQLLIYDPSIPKKEAPIIKITGDELKIEKVVLSKNLTQEAKDYLNPCDCVNYSFENGK